MRSIPGLINRFAYRVLRATLVRYVRAQPRDREGADRRVTILIASAWGMGVAPRMLCSDAGRTGNVGRCVLSASAAT